MKKTFPLILLILMSLSQLMAQSPQAFKYQAVVRDASNAPLANQAVAFRLSILQSSTSGTVVYQETHQPTTSDIGLVALGVGEGMVVSGSFASIDWGSAAHFLQVELDETGGSNYALLGSSQLQSVPYSIYANESGSASNDFDRDSTNELQSLAINGNDLSLSEGNTVTLPTFTAGSGISITNNVISAVGGGSEWQSNPNASYGTTLFVDTSRVGVGTNTALGIMEARLSLDSTAFRNNEVQVRNLNFMMSKSSNSNSENGVGLGFGSSSALNNGFANVGAAIVHERTGPGSQGKLHFATRPDGLTGQTPNIPISMTIDDQGDVGIGTLDPRSKLTVSDGTTNFEIRPGILDSSPNAGWTTLEMSGGQSLRVLDDLSVSDTIAIGSTNFPSDARLFVNGNMRVANDADLFGLDILQGFNDLRFAGDPNGNPDMVLDATGRIGIRGVFNNAAFSLINFPGNTGSNGGIFYASTTTGQDRLQVWDTASLGVFVIGNFTVTSGTKNFGLDHPLDPANKNLFHNAVESPGYVTYYHGTVQLDAKGEGVVKMPSYFEALNKDFNYQLTCIGGYAQVYIAEEIANNTFKVAGGKPGMKVSWQVTATRNDPYAQDHPYQAEQEKYPQQKGKYWYPQGYGKGREAQIGKREVEN